MSEEIDLTEIKNKLSKLEQDYTASKNITELRFNCKRISGFIESIIPLFKDKEQLYHIKKRFDNIDKYPEFYHYGLQENLKEQTTIVKDSINASPTHQKKVELKKYSIIQFPY